MAHNHDMSGMGGMGGMDTSGDLGGLDLGDIGGMDGMAGMDGGMGMSARPVKPSSFHKGYWAFIGAAIAVPAVAHLVNYFIYRQRIRAVRAGDPTPAKPKSPFMRHYSGLVAVMREAINASPSEFTLGTILQCLNPKYNANKSQSPILRRRLRLPTAGSVFMVLANLIALLVMCFYHLDPSQRWSYQAVALRVGRVSALQVPLIVLLAGRNNLIGLVTGIGYERLNWLHRWCARCLWVTATIHLSYWLVDWAPYDNFISFKIRNDALTARGLAAWCILTWITISSFSPIRRWLYEWFVLQHVLSFAAFLGVLYFHLPDDVRFCIWVSVAFVCFDRAIRLARLFYLNSAWFHPPVNSAGGVTPRSKGLFSCHAIFTPLENDATRITILNPPLQTWRPGQHLYLSCPALTPFQAHPFTIASIPKDKKIEFFIKAHNGATRRFLDYARHQSQQLPIHADDLKPSTKAVTIEGPYGIIRPPEQFDTVVLFAGALGATFCLPILRDIVSRWESMYSPPHTSPATSPPCPSLYAPEVAATRKIRFAWAVKYRYQLEWFSKELREAVDIVEALSSRDGGPDLELTVSIYVTCDDGYVGKNQQSGLHLHVRKPAASDQSGELITTPKVDHIQKTNQAERDWVKMGDLKDSDSIASSLSGKKVRSALPTETAQVTAQKLRGGSGVEESKPRCCCTEVVEEEDSSPGAQTECRCGSDLGMSCNTNIKDAPTDSRTGAGEVASPDVLKRALLDPSINQSRRDQTDTEISAGATTVVEHSAGTITGRVTSPHHHPLTTTTTAATPTPLQPSPLDLLSHPSIRLFTGRPSPQSIIQTSLERATGETAVLACGPVGMIVDVRAKTVALSDERAAGRSTGALGIWFFGEAFGL